MSFAQKYLLRKVLTIVSLAGALLPAAAFASDWAGATGNWSSNANPGWNGTGVPDGFGSIANHGVSVSSLTVQDVNPGSGVTVGTISLSNNSNHGWTILNNEGITFSNGGTSTLSNSNTGGTSQGSLEITAGTITLNDTLLINNTSTGSTIANGAIQISSLIAGFGNLTLRNTNNAMPASESSYAGAIRIQGFTNTFSGNVLVEKGLTTFNLAGSLGANTNAITIGAAGMGSATLLGTASVTMANPVTFEAGSGGLLKFGSMAAGSFSGTQTLNGDAIYHSGTAGGTVTTVTVSGAILGAGGLTKTGPDLLSLTNTGNFYAGNTTVSEGELRFASAGSIGGTGASVTVNSGARVSYTAAMDQAFLDRINSASAGTVALNANSSNALDFAAAGLTNVSLASIGARTYSGTLTPAGSTYRLGGGTGALTISTALAGAGNSVVVNGTPDSTADIIILSGANTYGGGTTVNSGQLRFTVPGAIGGAGANVTVNSGAIVSYGSTGNTMDQAFLNRINPSSTGILAMHVPSTNALDFAAAGLNNVSLAATGTSTYSGTLTPANNTFRLGGGTAALTVSSALTGAGNSLVVTGDASSTVAIVYLSTATNTYGGSTTVESGQLRFQTAAQIGGSGQSVMVNDGAIVSYAPAMDQAFLGRINPASNGAIALHLASANDLDFNALGLTGASLGATAAVTYSGVLTPAANTFRLGGGTSTLTVSSVLAGPNALVKTDGALATTVTLTGANTFDGPVSINKGTLSVASINSVAGGSPSSSLGAPTSAANGRISFGSGEDAGILTYTGAGETSDRVINLAGTTGGATITANGSSTTANPLILTGGVTATGAGSKTLTLQGNNLNGNTMSGMIVDNSPSNRTSLVKAGTGKWILSGPQNYTGTTAVTGGTLQFTSTQSLYNGDTTKWSAEYLSVTSGETFAINVGGAGEFALADITRFHYLSGVDGGLLSGAILGVDTSNGGNQTYADVLASKNTVGLTKLGANILTLSAANTYNGVTNVNGGTLRITGTHTGAGAYSVAPTTGTAGTLVMEPGSQITTGAQFAVGNAGVGTFVQNGGDLTVNATGLRVGLATGSVGSSYTMNGGTVTTATGVPVQIGYNTGGDATFTMNDGTINVGDWFVVAGFGTAKGHGFMHGGTINTTARFTIGQSAGTIGDFTMDSTVGSPSISTQIVEIGSAGTGTMTMNAGTITTPYTGGNGYVYVGNTGTGTMHQNAGSVTAGYELYVGVGAAGNGTYNLASGATLNAQYSNLGRDGTAVSALFNNSGTFNTTNELRVGANYNQATVLGGNATLNNLAGGAITAAQVYIGTGSNTLGYQVQGTINQSGAGSSITATSFFSVGRTTSSTGTFNLSDGTVTSAGDFNVGDYGTGILNQTGGSITTNDFVIAWQPSAVGTATLNGATATITTNNVNGVYVGRNGTGTFNVMNGTVNVLGTGDMRIGRENQLNAKGTLNQSGGVINIADQTYIGMRKVGDFNMSGGTYNAGDNVYIGLEATATGVLTQTGGTINVIGNEPNFTGNVLVGYNGSGAINMNGGLLDMVVTDVADTFDTLNSASHSLANTTTLDLAQDGNLIVGYLVGGVGTVTQTSGTIRVAANVFVGAGDVATQTGATGSYTMTGGQTIVGYTSPTGGDLVLGAFAGSSGTFNLQGGTLDVTRGSGKIGASLGTTAFNFTGGTLKVKEYNAANFGGTLGGLVQNGPASVLDVTGNDTLLNGGYTLTAGTAVIGPTRTLTIASPLTVGNGGAVKSAGSVAVSGGGADANFSTGGNYQWQLATLSTATPGTDFGIITVAGDLILGGTSKLTLDFTLLGANGPNSSNVFWDTNRSWKIVDTTTNAGSTNFASLLNGTFSSGSFATSIGTGPDLGDIFLTFTAGAVLHPGDFDTDGDVDGADFVSWQTNFPKTTGATLAQGDADGDGDVDGADFVIWQTNFPFTPGPGAAPVPEPSTLLLGALSAIGLFALRRRK